MKLNDFLAGVVGAKIVSLKTKTDVKLLAAGKARFPKGISKIASRNGTIGAKYQNAVNNKMASKLSPSDSVEDLPFFEAESLWKGKGRSVDNFLVEHSETGERYLKFLPKLDNDGFNRTESIYINNATGEEIVKADFEALLTPPSRGSFNGVNWQVIKTTNVIGFGQTPIDA